MVRHTFSKIGILGFLLLALGRVEIHAQEMPFIKGFYCEVRQGGATKADVWEKLKGNPFYSSKKEVVEKSTKKGKDGWYRFYGVPLEIDGEECSNQCPSVKYLFHECVLEMFPDDLESLKTISAANICMRRACDP